LQHFLPSGRQELHVADPKASAKKTRREVFIPPGRVVQV
jgi:hypothetical protein